MSVTKFGTTSFIKDKKFLTKTESINQFVDARGDSMSGNLFLNNNQIKGIADPIDKSDCVNLAYLENQLLIKEQQIKQYMDNVAKFIAQEADKKVLLLDGSSKPTANIDMNNNNLINLKDPINSLDAVNKRYCDNSNIFVIHDRYRGRHGWNLGFGNSGGFVMLFDGWLRALGLSSKKNTATIKSNVAVNEDILENFYIEKTPGNVVESVVFTPPPHRVHRGDRIFFTNDESLKPGCVVTLWISKYDRS